MILRLAGAVLTLVVWAAGPAAGQTPEAWVSFPVGVNHNLVVRADGVAAARIPVAPVSAALAGKALQVRPTDVIYKEGRSTALSSAFRINFQPASATNGAAFLVSLEPLDGVIAPGAYVLGGQVADDLAIRGNAAQAFVLTLTQPAPRIVTSTKVVVGQTVGFVGSASAPGRLSLTEQDGKAGARGLVFTDFNDQSAAGAPESGRLAFSPAASSSVTPNGTLDIAVSTRADFPLGTTSGRIEVRSPSLAATISVPFEVKVRRDRALIVICAGLGVVLGLTLRVWLAKRQLLLASSDAAYEQMAAMLKDIESIKDSPFRKAMSSARDALDSALQQDDPVHIVAATKQAHDDAAALRKTLNDSLPPLAGQAQILQDLLFRRWILPPQLDRLLLDMRQDLRGVERLLEDRDARGAQAQLHMMQSNGLTAIVNAAEAHALELALYLQTLASEPPPAPVAFNAELRAFALGAVGRFKSPATVWTAPTIDEARAVLEDVGRQFQQAQALADEAPPLARELLDTVRTRLQLFIVPSQPEWLATGSLSLAAAEALPDDIAQPARARLRLEARAAAVRAAWRTWLLALAPTAPVAEIEAALADNSWGDAAELALKALRTAAPEADAAAPRGNLLERLGRQTAELHAVPWHLPATETAGPLGTQLRLQNPPSLPEVLRRRRATQSESKWLAAVQSVAFGTIFVTGTYVLYADSWVGTPREMLVIVMLAFGVDLSSDSVLAAFKNLKLPAA